MSAETEPAPPVAAVRADQDCTGLTAAWCPIHGDCTCVRSHEDERAGYQYDEGQEGEPTMDRGDCPLHGDLSDHPRAAVRADQQGPEAALDLNWVVQDPWWQQWPEFAPFAAECDVRPGQRQRAYLIATAMSSFGAWDEQRPAVRWNLIQSVLGLLSYESSLLARQQAAAAPSGADQQEPDDPFCHNPTCEYASIAPSHQHGPNGGVPIGMLQPKPYRAGEKVGSAAAPSTPGAPDSVDIASMEPAEVAMTLPDGSTRQVTRVPLREEFPIGPGDPESAPPPAVQGAPGGDGDAVGPHPFEPTTADGRSFLAGGSSCWCGTAKGHPIHAGAPGGKS